MSQTDIRFMKLALALGRRGLGQCASNPAVGCVIVKDERIIGRGWTQPGGRPHAEPVALAQAGTQAKGATVYVTLEPCAHQGQTPPCAKALISAEVARVVVACRDPDPRVDGGGIAMLEAAGITVDLGVCADDADTAHAGFFKRLRERRPFITLKLAASLDGRIATGTGHSQWITGPAARRAVHAMRARHDAVMVGAGTARHDDPSLTVRDLGVSRQPARIVMSRRLDIPLMGQLAKTATEVPVYLCHGKDADPALRQTWTGLGATMVECAARGTQVDPIDALEKLAGHGFNRIFCEGGGALAASLIDAGLVDELVLFTAGLAIGAEGLPGIGALGLGRLDEASRYTLQKTQAVGGDVMQVWRRD